MTKPSVLGLLGGIGSGKSTVARWLADAVGAQVLDADAMAHACLDEPEVRAALRAAFGDVLDAAGGIDRRRLAERAFADERGWRTINAIVHPCVRRRLAERLDRISREGSTDWVVLDVPLLLEADLESLCDVVLFVDASRATRLARVRERSGWSEEELDRREKFQKAIEEKRAAADYTVANDGPPEALHAQLRALLQELTGSISSRDRSARGHGPV